MDASSTADRENPRTRRVRKVVLAAATDVLLESGAQQVTAATVAERADVARTTIYRHWPDQRSLLLDTIHHLTSPSFPSELMPGEPAADGVHRVLRQLRTRLETRQVREVFGALAGFAAQDESFADAQRLFVEQLVQPTVLLLDAAKDRGELRPSMDSRMEAMLLTSPILHQHLARHDEISTQLIDEVAQRWLKANMAADTP